MADAPLYASPHRRLQRFCMDVAEGVWDFVKDETSKSLFVWFQLGLVTGTLALLETSNKPLAAISIVSFVSVMSFALYDVFGWYGTAPFLIFVVVLSVAMYRTIALIDEMDEFASDFKLADLKLQLGELQDEEQRRRKEVGCVNVCF